MKALYLEGIGKELVLKDVPVPSPLAPDEVLVKTELTGICYRDILTTKGFFPRTKLSSRWSWGMRLQEGSPSSALG